MRSMASRLQFGVRLLQVCLPAKYVHPFNCNTTSDCPSLQYNDGIPKGSRFDNHGAFFNDTIKKLESPEGKVKLEKIRTLTKFAKDELDTGIIQLSLAFIAALPTTGTVILGASSATQLEEQLLALDIIPKMTPQVIEKIEEILDNKPKQP